MVSTTSAETSSYSLLCQKEILYHGMLCITAITVVVAQVRIKPLRPPKMCHYGITSMFQATLLNFYIIAFFRGNTHHVRIRMHGKPATHCHINFLSKASVSVRLYANSRHRWPRISGSWAISSSSASSPSPSPRHTDTSTRGASSSRTECTPSCRYNIVLGGPSTSTSCVSN